MAIRGWNDSRLFERALIASLGVHLLVALFLPAWMPPQSQGPQPIEALSFAKVMRIQVLRPAAAAPKAAVPETDRRAAHVSFARHKNELSAKTRKPLARPTAVDAPRGRIAAAPARVAHRHPAPLYARAPASSVPIATTVSTSAQTPKPEASVDTRAVAGTGQADRGGALPFGATQDPVLDPGVLARLQRQFSGVTLLITVDENGRTEKVAFQPPLDPEQEQRIETILQSANWDAAVCGGGVTCEGTATIKL